ncbi:MAG: tetratricopeptide repeat-containing protein kinase family protein [Verrucomicrobiota bacterium]
MRIPDIPGYQLTELLSEDSFGWSFLALGDDRVSYVVRFLKNRANDMQLARDCAAALKEPVAGLAELVTFIEAEDDSPFATVWRSCHFGGDDPQGPPTTLENVAEKLSDSQKNELITNLGTLLGAFHKQGVYHGGLLPSNVFVESTTDGKAEARVAFFGERITSTAQYVEARNLPFFLSPEQLLAPGNTNGIAADVYAFGVLVHLLYTGQFPRLQATYERYLEDPKAMEAPALFGNGQAAPIAKQVHALLAEEPEVFWHSSLRSDENGPLRRLLENCLAFDPKVRTTDLLGAINQFKSEQPKVSFDAAAADPVHSPVPVPVGEAVDEDFAEDLVEVEEQEEKASSAPAEEEAAAAELDAVADESEPEEEKGFGFKGEGSDSEPTEAELAKPKAKGRFGTMGDIPTVPKYALFGLAALLMLMGILAMAQGLRMSRLKKVAELEVAQREAEIAEVTERLSRERAAKAEQEGELQAEIDTISTRQSQLEGETQLAKQFLKESQVNGDVFFDLVLKNKDSDIPEFREQRETGMRKAYSHYRRLLEIYGNAEEFVDSGTDAYYYLGRICQELGEHNQAGAYLAHAEKRYVELLKQPEGELAKWSNNLAETRRSLGEMTLMAGQYEVAANHFDQSSVELQRLRELDPSQSLDVAVRVNENSIDVVRCLVATGEQDSAEQGIMSVGGQFTELMEKFPEDDRIVGGLAQTFSITGDIFEAKGSGADAIKAFKQAGDLYGKAIKMNAAVDTYHLGLGNALARVGLAENDLKKLRSAADVLGEVIPRNPNEPAYQKSLAEVYGVMASNQRDGGNYSNAIKLEEEAVKILKTVTDSNPNTPSDIRFALSERLMHMAELMVDAKDFNDSRMPLKSAIAELETINQLPSARPEFHRSLAKARGLAGFSSAKAGDKASAKVHYEAAKKHWADYVAANPSDSDAVANQKWANDQLRSL